MKVKRVRFWLWEPFFYPPQHKGTAAALHVQPQTLATPTAARAQSRGLDITGTWERF